MKVFKLFWNLLCHMVKHRDHYISRWLRGLHEKPKGRLGELPPLHFDEAIFVLMEMADKNPQFKQMFRESTVSHEFASSVHHGFGQVVRNEWQLWDIKSSLHRDMKAHFSLFHADDMSGVLLQVAWQRFRCLPETPGIIAMGYMFYWQDLKRKGQWNGLFADKDVDFKFSWEHRKRIDKEKHLLLKYNK